MCPSGSAVVTFPVYPIASYDSDIEVIEDDYLIEVNQRDVDTDVTLVVVVSDGGRFGRARRSLWDQPTVVDGAEPRQRTPTFVIRRRVLARGGTSRRTGS
jgi:hypothetical protein